jgi:outer membrane protein OmpA-like peptidoglycan-associated protein
MRTLAQSQSNVVSMMPHSGLLQRNCACGQHTVAGEGCEECKKKHMSLDRKSGIGSAFDAVPPIVHDVLRSPGQPLDSKTRTFFEPRFGRDFSQVRVHTDSKAADSATAVNALAYTVGRDVVFGQGRYTPSTNNGQRLLAHELTHVVQQDGRDCRSDTIEIGASDTALEQEANSSAERLRSNGLESSVNQPTAVSRTILQRACPPVPTGLGATPGSEPCVRKDGALVAGKNLLFCQDSDELTSGQTSWLASVTADAKAATSVEIHGNASTEGPKGDPDYNIRLACKRAAAIAAHLRAASVTAPITLFTHGPTAAYGPAESNRNVVVRMTAPAPVSAPASALPKAAEQSCIEVPRIVAVQGDVVSVENALGAPEKVSLRDFGTDFWKPGNPANPVMLRANDCYQSRRMKILTEAGHRPQAVISDCNDSQKRAINSALTTAATASGSAVGRLRSALNGVESALAQVEFHFKTKDKNDVRLILDNLTRVKDLISDVTGFSCGGSVCEKHGNWIAWSQFTGATMHACDIFFNQSPFEQALTIIHEACHVVFDAGDPGQNVEALKLKRAEAMVNAQSYAHYAMGKYTP